MALCAAVEPVAQACACVGCKLGEDGAWVFLPCEFCLQHRVAV